jgi:[ribosomal protein S18]-alanine N-acetyltransferase
MAASDADSLLAIARESVAAPNWGLADYQKILLSDPAEPFFRIAAVADLGGVLTGFAVTSVLRIEELATLESIVVHPGFRRQGIGAALVASAMRSAAEGGARLLTLEVRVSNVAAIGLYLRRGFQQRGRRRGYYSDPGEDALLFEAALTGVSG